MLDWLTTLADRLGLTGRLSERLRLSTTELFWISVGLFLVMFVGSIGVVTWVLIRLPPTYFLKHHPPAFAWEGRHPALFWTARIAKNVVGVLLVLLGILLSVPLVPGQGVLTILIGLLLLEFPGKRWLERKLVSRPQVHQAIDRLRLRFGKPPLVLEEAASSTCPPGRPSAAGDGVPGSG